MLNIQRKRIEVLTKNGLRVFEKLRDEYRKKKCEDLWQKTHLVDCLEAYDRNKTLRNRTALVCFFFDMNKQNNPSFKDNNSYLEQARCFEMTWRRHRYVKCKPSI